MKNLVILLVSVLAINPTFAQKGAKKPHPMSMHFGWRNQTVTRVTFGYPGIYTKQFKNNELPTGYNGPFDMSRNFSGMLEIFSPVGDPENQRGVGIKAIHNGPLNMQMVSIAYGAAAPCDLFYNIFRANVCGVYQIGPALRFRKFDQEIAPDKYQRTDVGGVIGFTGANKKTAFKSAVYVFGTGPVSYDIMVYKYPMKGILLGAGAIQNRPTVSIGSICRKARLSLDVSYDTKVQALSAEAKLIFAFEDRGPKKPGQK